MRHITTMVLACAVLAACASSTDPGIAPSAEAVAAAEVAHLVCPTSE